MASASELVKPALSLAQSLETFTKEAGYKAHAERLARLRVRWKEGTVAIAIAGMQKRGKSRLINALLDRPGLVPVDDDVATNAYISLRYGEQFAAYARYLNQPPQPISVDELYDYASMQGDALKRQNVLSVDVGFKHPLLQGVRLFDTPGVDSLTLGHMHSTRQVVAQADVLIFAISGQDQPLLRHEADFLIEASKSVHRIAFVLTKIDSAPRWKDLLDANRERLRNYVSQTPDGQRVPDDVQRRLIDAEWFPVSSLRAERAALRRAEGNHERADEFLGMSGLRGLIEFIQDAAQQREILRLGPLLDSFGAILVNIEQAEQDQLAAATEDDETLERNLNEAKEALARVNDRVQQRRQAGTALGFLGNDIGRLARSRIAERQREFHESVDRADLGRASQIKQFAGELPESLARSLDALWDELLVEVQNVTEQTLNQFTSGLGLEATTVVLDDVTRTNRAIDGPNLRTQGSGKVGGLDPIGDGIPMVTLSYSLAMISTNVLPMIGIASLGPIGWVAGPALAAALVWRRGEIRTGAQAKSELKRYISDVLAQARDDFTSDLTKLVTAKRTEVEVAVDRELAQQRRELNTRADEAKRTMNLDGATRRKTADTARARLATATTLKATLAQVQSRLTQSQPAAAKTVGPPR